MKILVKSNPNTVINCLPKFVHGSVYGLWYVFK